MSNRVRHLFVAALWGAAIPAWLPAASTISRPSLADLSLQELLDVQFDTVSTASRRRQRIWEAPASVSIVGRDEIRAFGHRTVAEALAGLPGLYTTDDRYYTYLGIRGFSRPGDYNSRVLLLVDGSRANDSVYDSGWVAHESPVDVDNVERVEVIRGPSSSLYGSSAFFGTVNVITRRGGSLNGVEVSGDAGSLHTRHGRVAAGWKLRSGLEFFAAASFHDTRGEQWIYFPEFDAPETNSGVAERLDFERAHHFALNASWGDLTLSGTFVSRIRGIPTASFLSVFNDPRMRTRDLAGHVDLKFERELASGTQVMARAGWHRYDYGGIYPYDIAGDGEPSQVVLNRDFGFGDWWGTEATLSRRFADVLTVTGGVELRRNYRQEQRNYYESDPRQVFLDGTVSRTARGVFAQADWAPSERVVLSAGVRHDHFTTFGGSTNPRIGLMFRPWTDGAIKLLYGRAFRAPNAYEADYVTEGQNPNPDLKPETISTYETVLEQQLVRGVKATASVSYYRVAGLITYDYDPVVASFQNMDEARTLSGEAGLEGRWDNGWFTRLSYTLQDAEDGFGEHLTNSPRSLAKAQLRIPFLRERASLGLEARRTGSVRTVQPGRADAAWTANATLFVPDVAGMEIAASVYNLLDRRVDYTGFDEHRQRILPGYGRAFRVRVTRRF